MLVLTRGRNDKVVFPTLGISVEILRVAGNKVRLGIDAPKTIPVLRHEIPARNESMEQPESIPFSAELSCPTRISHSVRNRLNSAALGLHYLHRMFESDQLNDAEATIFKVFNELKAIESEIDGGTGSQPAASRTVAEEWAAPQLSHHPRALVVEDDDNERELLAGCLRMSGVEVETAVDGLQAMVRLTQGGRPNVVLLDMKMPQCDGSKTVSAIRDNPNYRDVRLFAVTGASQEEMNISVGPNGVDRWFTKPVNPQQLLNALREDLPSEFLSS